MQVTLVSSDGLKRTLKVELPAESLEQQVESRLKGMTKTVKVNGFRPGKVPLSVVKSRFADSVRQELLGGLIQQSFGEAAEQQSLTPAGYPQFSVESADPNNGYVYTAEFEVYPEIEPADVSKLKIDTVEASVADSDVDDMIDSLRQQRMTYSPVKRKSKLEDQVNIDFTGYLDDEPFEGGAAQGVDLVLGSGQMIPGFEDEIVGMKAGDERRIDLTFPEQYQAEQLAGKAAQFDIVCNEVRSPKLPKIDEEFLASLGVESGKEKDLREDVRANMERELGNAVEQQNKENVMEGLLSVNEFDIPESTVSEEIARLKEQFNEQMRQQGQNQALGDLPDELFRERAERRVRLGLLISEIVKSKQIEVDEDEVQKKLIEISSAYDQPQEVVEYYNSNPELMQNVRGIVLESAVVNWALENAKTATTESNFKDMMAAAAQQR